MFETPGSSLHKHIARKIALWTLVGLGLWVILLIHTSAEFDKQSVSRQSNVTLGPLTLNSISKKLLESGGHKVVISFEPDLLWYASFWLVAGAAHGFITAKRATPPKLEPHAPKASSPL